MIRALFLVLLASLSPARASMFLTGIGAPPPAAPTYIGPGDQFSGAEMFVGVRGYNGAYATGSNNAFNYRRASDNATQNGVILTSGAFDIATANTFAGTDATCTGTISSTTLVCASASSTPHAGSTLTGAGITQPSWIVSCGTFTGGAGTCTLNAAQTVSVGETITMQYGLYVTEAYDQSGTGNNLTQSTAGNQPQLLPNCGLGLSSLPCMWFNGTSQYLQISSAAGSFSPLGTEMVFNSTTGCSSYCIAIGVSTGGNATQIGAGSSANIDYVASGSVLNGTASNSVWHVVQGVYGSSGVISVDGTESTGATGTVGATASSITVGASGGSFYLTGPAAEAIVWGASASGTQRTNLCHNGRIYYGTAGSC
jgi:hypothetical protein